MGPNSQPRSAGMLFPVFSMRREGDLGVGDTTSVKLALDWVAESGVGFLQLLPINVSGDDHSPYSAISSVALDYIYIDLKKVPELTSDDFVELREEFGTEWLDGEQVDYETVKTVKARLLRRAYHRYEESGEVNEEFEKFCIQEREWLDPYCKFRWLMEEAGGSADWTGWPTQFNTPHKALQYEAWRDELTDGGPQAVQEYYAWVQWIAFSQWREVRRYADEAGVKLMGDVPIGVSCASADVFFEPQWFDLGWYGGAPPEKVFKDDAFACKWGQNWGIPLYRWDKLKEDGFSWWRRRIAKLTDIFHIFRIDHILGFYRIYAFPWHPKENSKFLPLDEAEAKEITGGELPKFYPRADDTMKHKAQNLMDGDDYLKEILKAAEGYDVVGEDLGCVPDYVRPHLAEIGIAGFKICHWETNAWGRALEPENHPECAFATFATHDHPPIYSMWEDLRYNIANGCGGSGDGLRIISQYADLPEIDDASLYPPYNGVIKWALLESLMKSNARYACLMINDLEDSRVRINTPGTLGDHNWTYRTQWSLNDVPNTVSEEMRKLSIYIQKHHRYPVKRIEEQCGDQSAKPQRKNKHHHQ